MLRAIFVGYVDSIIEFLGTSTHNKLLLFYRFVYLTSETMKTAFAASALAMVGCTEAFVAPLAARASLSPSNALDTTRASTSVRSTPSMEFAGGLRGADGPEPNSKNFDPLGFAEARPENLLFFREAEIKVRFYV